MNFFDFTKFFNIVVWVDIVFINFINYIRFIKYVNLIYFTIIIINFFGNIIVIYKYWFIWSTTTYSYYFYIMEYNYFTQNFNKLSVKIHKFRRHLQIIYWQVLILIFHCYYSTIFYMNNLQIFYLAKKSNICIIKIFLIFKLYTRYIKRTK